MEILLFITIVSLILNLIMLGGYLILKSELKQAMKNDHRDAKGRFKKAYD